MVDQPGGDIDGVAVTVAGHLDDLATRQRHLQTQHAQAGRGAALTAPRDDGLEHVVHDVGGLGRSGGGFEDGHEAVAEGLHHPPAGLVHRPHHGVHAVRDDRGRLGIAERLEQRGAAPEVGKQDGAFGDLCHSARKFSVDPLDKPPSTPFSHRMSAAQRLSR